MLKNALQKFNNLLQTLLFNNANHLNISTLYANYCVLVN